MEKFIWTTPRSPQQLKVVEAMMLFFKEWIWQPSSLHQFGRITSDAIQFARTQVANLIHAKPNEIIFTSASGTEANNFAIKGILASHKKRETILLPHIEHFQCSTPLKSLEKSGYVVTYLPVDKYGMVNRTTLKRPITPTTTMVSIMYANGRLGR